MPYSPIPVALDPAIDALKIIASDTTIYIAPDAFGKTGSTPTWTGLTLGNDTTGDGTLAKPFATLKKAWDAAKEYFITGNTQLTIQFQKGIYTAETETWFPEDLNHPQGQNIIITGDPAAVKQHYLWRVEGYSWDLSEFSGYGHTGNAYLWSRDGGTAHGYTGQDIGGYVTISNASLGSRDYYSDLYSGAPGSSGSFEDRKYSTTLNSGRSLMLSVGNHFFNHKLPYEEADGILGLAKIGGASANAGILNLVFKNANVDTRVPSYIGSTQIGNGGWVGYSDTSPNSGRIPSGLRNNASWAGSTNNYPETQYSEPNGYYGLTAWNNSATVASGFTYPSLPAGVTHITDDVHVVTNFPVVIRYNQGFSKRAPLNLYSSKLKAIQNLMFVNSNLDGWTDQGDTPVNGATGPEGATAGTYSSSVSIREMLTETGRGKPHLLNVEDGEVGIRHIGALGFASAVNAINSKVTRWDDRGLQNAYTDSEGHTAGFHLWRANPKQPLYNCPVITASHMISGILAQNSEIDFLNGTDQDPYNPPNDTEYNLSRSNPVGKFLTDNSVWIQTVGYVGWPVLATNNSKVKVSNIWTSTLSSNPSFLLTINLPVYAGSTSGLSAGVYNHESWYNSVYKNITLYMDLPTSLGSGYGAGITVGRLFFCQNGGITFSGGGWSGSSWTNNSAGYGTGQPLYHVYTKFYGYKMGNVNLHEGQDWVTALTTNGGTLCIRAYSDNEGTNLISGLTMNIKAGSANIQMHGRNGSRIHGTTATAMDLGVSFGFYNQWYSHQTGNRSITVHNNSEMYVDKLMVVKGGYRAIDIGWSSKLKCRVRGQSSIVVSEYAKAAVSIHNNSEGVLGNILVKNPQVYGSTNSLDAVKPEVFALLIENNSKVHHEANLVQVAWPFAAAAFNSHAGATIGFGSTADAKESLLRTYNNSGMVSVRNGSDYYGYPSSASAGTTFDLFALENVSYPIISGHRVSIMDGHASGFTQARGQYGSSISYYNSTDADNYTKQVNKAGIITVVNNSSLSPAPFKRIAGDLNTNTSGWGALEYAKNNLYSWAHMADVNGCNLPSRLSTRATAGNFTATRPVPTYNNGTSSRYYQWWDVLKGNTFGSVATAAGDNNPSYVKFGGYIGYLTSGDFGANNYATDDNSGSVDRGTYAAASYQNQGLIMTPVYNSTSSAGPNLPLQIFTTHMGHPFNNVKILT